MKLADKIALVTGGSRSIGRAIVERYAREGALVVVHYGSGRSAAQATVQAVEPAGGAAFLQRWTGALIFPLARRDRRSACTSIWVRPCFILISSKNMTPFGRIMASFDRLRTNGTDLAVVTKSSIELPSRRIAESPQ